MRKKTWAKDVIAQSNFIVNEPQLLKGKWNDFTNGKIHLEIGSGKGDYWIGMSKLYPTDFFIGVEKDESCTGIALRKCANQERDNKLFIQNDAANLLEWFDEDEIDIIHLNFSDPWPKKHHSKRRLTAPTFLSSYQKILKKDGLIIMKTDNKQLFEFSLISFCQNGYLLEDVSVDYRREIHDEDIITEYERNFMELNQPIYRCVFKVNK